MYSISFYLVLIRYQCYLAVAYCIHTRVSIWPGLGVSEVERKFRNSGTCYGKASNGLCSNIIISSRGIFSQRSNLYAWLPRKIMGQAQSKEDTIETSEPPGKSMVLVCARI